MTDFIDKIFLDEQYTKIKELPDECVDLILTYPPINMIDHEGFVSRWMKEAKRVLKPSGSMYVFSIWKLLKPYLITIDDLDLNLINHIIWKYQFGSFVLTKYVTSHAHVLYVAKRDKDRNRTFNTYGRYAPDDRTLRGGSAHYLDKQDVWDIKQEYWRGEDKVSSKIPKEVINKILDYSTNEGDVVFDPFSVVGQVAYVSGAKKRKYIAFENDKDNFRIANERIRRKDYMIIKDINKQPQLKFY